LSKEASSSSQLVIQIVNSSFVDNVDYYLSFTAGAALSIADGVAGDVVISDCLFEKNSADEGGGAIYLWHVVIDLNPLFYVPQQLSSTLRRQCNLQSSLPTW